MAAPFLFGRAIRKATPDMSFALPVCRSSFSILYGVAAPEAIVRRGRELGYANILLADKNNLYGCHDFYLAAQEFGLKPIIGAELTTELGRLFFLCKSHGGFQNLSRLITACHLRGRPDIDSLLNHRAGLICVAPPIERIHALKDIFQEDLYIAVTLHNPSAAFRYAKTLKVKAAAFPIAAFLKRDDFPAHRLLRAIEGGYLLDNMPTSESAGHDDHLRESDYYGGFFSRFPGATENNAELAEKCNLIFPSRRNLLPDIDIAGDHLEQLRELALSGLLSRISYVGGKYLSRLEYELSVIRRTGFIDYFLIVGDIVDYCRQKGIPAVGRGSAAGSLAAFGLGITQVDPIKENLYFERFLNEARSDCPDIDLDIDWRRRDDVLNYIYEKYGRDRVAMIATYIRFRPRLAIREAARAFGVLPEKIERFIRRHFPEQINELSISKIPSQNDSRYRAVLDLSGRIAGLPRHLGIHPGGIVIAPEPLTNYTPLETTTKGLVVTQCDMYQAEKIGLVKIDILGQRGLAVIADCQDAIRAKIGASFYIPDNDAKTYETLRNGKTIGVFQMESPGLRALLKALRPRELNDITLALALIRPGASESGMKRIFLNRFHGNEKIAYPYEKLESILKETLGVFIYQEQVILAAREIAGFNLPASDLLRRAIAKKRLQKDIDKALLRFLKGASENGVPEKRARAIFSQLAQFASFGFCKAHAATYGFLAYQSAYFKTHYPDIFMAAVLRNGGGYYPSAVYVAEARRLGVPVAPPDVNLSAKSDQLINGKIYLAIARIRQLSETSMERIIMGRPFASFDDFLRRVRLSEEEMENLIKVGFFDSLEGDRRRLLWKYRLRRKAKNNGADFFGRATATAALKNMPLTPLNDYEIFLAEKEILELPASFHPLTLFKTYEKVSMDTFCELRDDSPVALSGWLADCKRIKTRDGKSMIFLAFDSLDDTFEVVLFPEIYRRFAEIIRKYHYLRVEGRINVDGGNPAIIASRIYPSPTGLREAKYI
jgi:DNA-directed DNA polymerase III PolC